MERCECLVNRLLKALEQLANSFISNRQVNTSSITESGETLQGLDNSHMNLGTNTNSILTMGLIAMILFCLVIRNRDRRVNNNDNKLGFSGSKMKDNK